MDLNVSNHFVMNLISTIDYGPGAGHPGEEDIGGLVLVSLAP